MKAIVIGGGVVGLSVALRLQARHIDVILIEPQRQSQASSYGNAGHIAVEQVEPLASLATIRSARKRLFARGGALSLPLHSWAEWLPFSLRLMRAAAPGRFAGGKAALSGLIARAMPAWQAQLEDIGATDLLRCDGHFVVWESPETAKAGLAAWQAGDTGTAKFRPATSEELGQLGSVTGRTIYGAIRFEGTGQISDNRRLLETLAAKFIERGGRILPERVARVNADGVTLAGGERLQADQVVVAAGIASKPLMEGLGFKVPMIAERGYHIQAARHGWPDGLPPVVFEDRSMIVTGFEGGLRAASFVEFARAEAPPDPRKWARLKAHVAALQLPFEGQVTEWTGARPTLPDYLPAIGRASDKVWYAFGHQHLGLTLAAVTGDIVADMVTGGAAPAAFDLKRFG